MPASTRINTALTILEDFPKKAIEHRKEKHRDDYLERCTRQGEHLPSDAQITRWWESY